jgi:hypothetical protein
MRSNPSSAPTTLPPNLLTAAKPGRHFAPIPVDAVCGPDRLPSGHPVRQFVDIGPPAQNKPGLRLAAGENLDLSPHLAHMALGRQLLEM